ncbi:MAG TPA: amino acid ABC transporter permease [Casimicrobiaceae bacterium]|nr:amino acid ABC transporter permease [Casimicrobiaceae bacterium]
MPEMLKPPSAATLPERWRKTLFGDTPSAVVSSLLLLGVVWALWQAIRWGVFDAVVKPDVSLCRAADGACWGVLVEKARLVLLGRFPQGEQWRPILGSLALLGCVGAAAHPRCFGRVGLVLMVAGVTVFGVLMAGGILGLTPVGTDLWGGLPLTLLLAVIALLLGVPIGIALALGRRSKLPAVKWLSTTYIELVRGLPLITLLFFGAFVLPVLLPAQWRLDPMLRIGICLTMFAAAYLAEVFRGGLQAVTRGQYEASHALGLSKWQTLTRVVLPQALRITIAPTASLFIGTVKDTALVSIVNIYDLTGTLKLAMDAEWRPYSVEMYIMVSAIYLAIGLSIATYGRYLERRYALK